MYRGQVWTEAPRECEPTVNCLGIFSTFFYLLNFRLGLFRVFFGIRIAILFKVEFCWIVCMSFVSSLWLNHALYSNTKMFPNVLIKITNNLLNITFVVPVLCFIVIIIILFYNNKWDGIKWHMTT